MKRHIAVYNKKLLRSNKLSLEKVCVTRHKALYDYLVLHSFVPEGTKCLSRADAIDIRGKHVYGKLPYHLSSCCALYTELDMRIPLSMRGKELTVGQVEFYLIKPRTYRVREVTR